MKMSGNGAMSIRNKKRRRRVIRGMITKTRASAEQLAARLGRAGSNAAGTHSDQNWRKDPKRLRRDKSFRDER